MIMKCLDVGIIIAVAVIGVAVGAVVVGSAAISIEESDRELLIQCVEESNNAGLCFDLLT